MAAEQTKVLMLGDAGVGKTSLLHRYIHGAFDSQVRSTVGIDFMLATWDTPTGERFRAQVFDTAGQEKHAALVGSYYRNATVAIFVFDVCSEESYQGVLRWNAELEQKSNVPHVLKVLFGNKADIDPPRRVITPPRGEGLASTIGARYFEASALQGFGVRLGFGYVFEQAWARSRDPNWKQQLPPSDPSLRDLVKLAPAPEPVVEKGCKC